MLEPSEKDIARFWRFVNRLGADDCWEWQGSLVGGYGHFTIGYRYVKAVHFSLLLDGRPRPEGLMCCHSCDNRACVNPRHLRWDTREANEQDKKDRNRHAKGSSSGVSSKAITEADIPLIRQAYADGEPTQQIADRFGITRDAVWGICLGRTWRHVEAGPITRRGRGGPRPGSGRKPRTLSQVGATMRPEEDK